MNKDKIKEFFKDDRYASLSGIEIVDVDKGYSKTKLEIEDKHLNAANVVQGGAIFTLADFVFAGASNSPGTVAGAINVSISYLKAANKGSLFAEAKEIAFNPKIASYTVNVTNEAGEMIAVFQGMVYRKKETILTAS